MKILGRVLYSLVWVLLFVFLISYTRTQISEKYFNKYANEALESENVNDKFGFFYKPAGYHKKTPIYQLEENGFILHFYEIVRKDVDGIEREYLYIFFYDTLKKFKLDKDERLIMVFEQENDKNDRLSIKQFRNLNLFVALNDKLESLIDKEFFFKKKVLKIEIRHIKKDKTETLMSQNITFKETDFVIKNILKEKNYNNEEIKKLGVFPKEIYSGKEFMSVAYINFSIYFACLIGLSFFVFVFKLSWLKKTKQITFYKSLYKFKVELTKEEKKKIEKSYEYRKPKWYNDNI